MTVKKLSEHEMQVLLCKHLDKVGLEYWAVPNGFIHNGDKNQTIRYIKYMKAEGVKNGVFDLTILLGNGRVAFLEMKTDKGKPRKEQLEWLEKFQRNHYPAKICYGLKEAIEAVDELATFKHWNDG